MNSRLLLYTGLLSLVSVPALSGALYGTVRLGGAPAGGITLVVSCPGFDAAGARSAQGVADASGSYSLNVPASGRCEMRIQSNGRIGAPFEVLVSENPVRFDLKIDGALSRVP
jgi:hypothetical protein